MRIPMLYAMVVLVWGSTPLGIKLSSDSFSFMSAVTARMGLALSLALLILLILRKPLIKNASDWRVYFAASLGIFPALPLVYWSAQFISTGLISVLFGLTPFVTGLMSILLLRNNPFDWQKIAGLLLAMVGLLIIFQGQLQLGEEAVWGVLAVLASVVVFAFSSVSLQGYGSNIEPIRQTAGALLLSFPTLLLAWVFLDGQLPERISFNSGAAILYLAVFGSLLGFPAYFYLLKHLSAATVSLTTLMTPAIALILGAWIVGEQLQASLVLGAGLIVLSLFFYQGLLLKLYRLWRARKLSL